MNKQVKFVAEVDGVKMKVFIFTEGSVTLCKLETRLPLIEEGVRAWYGWSNRNPGDSPDPRKGMRIALEKALDNFGVASKARHELFEHLQTSLEPQPREFLSLFIHPTEDNKNYQSWHGYDLVFPLTLETNKGNRVGGYNLRSGLFFIGDLNKELISLCDYTGVCKMLHTKVLGWKAAK